MVNNQTVLYLFIFIFPVFSFINNPRSFHEMCFYCYSVTVIIAAAQFIIDCLSGL